MLYEESPLKGCYVIHTNPFIDKRGIFARFFCERELDYIIEDRKIVNVNFSRTLKKGSIRGMHFQLPPDSEMKFIRCIKGKIYDVAIDIRESSATFLKWFGVELSDTNMDMLVIPEGFAHGFQTLTDNCELVYLHTWEYVPESERGINVLDPLLNISWPLPILNLSKRDKKHPFIDKDYDGVKV